MAPFIAGFNGLTALPEALQTCKELRVLEARNNKVSVLPPALCRLQLTLLDLSNNNLSALPADLAEMTSLRSMPLNGNKLRSIRPELITGPLQNLLKFLQSRCVVPCVTVVLRVSVSSGSVCYSCE